MARYALPDGKRADFGVKVEDAGGKEIYRASMNFLAKSQDEIDREDEEAVQRTTSPRAWAAVVRESDLTRHT